MSMNNLICRYIPLSRTIIPLSTDVAAGPDTFFPSLSSSDKIEKSNSTTLVRLAHGSADVAAKVSCILRLSSI